jgi:hypothetical protein
MINQHSWMFLSSYVDLRTQIIDNIQFETLLHLGPKTFLKLEVRLYKMLHLLLEIMHQIVKDVIYD